MMVAISQLVEKAAPGCVCSPSSDELKPPVNRQPVECLHRDRFAVAEALERIAMNARVERNPIVGFSTCEIVFAQLF